MNHTIIKKALNEALARKYYDELMKTEDEEHIFSVGFTADMKRLKGFVYSAAHLQKQGGFSYSGVATQKNKRALYYAAAENAV